MKLDCAVVKTHFKLLCICMVLIRLPLFDHVINKASLKFIVLKVGKEVKHLDFLDTAYNFEIVKSKFPHVWMRKDIDQSSVYMRRA